jgi:Rad3-related DNA helicase
MVCLQVSRELEKESVVVFDEAHNIDNVCIEALSINLRDATLSAASRNLQQLTNEIQRVKMVCLPASPPCTGLSERGSLCVHFCTRLSHKPDKQIDSRRFPYDQE